MNHDVISMLVVGAVWGCTNPFVRRGHKNLEASSNDSQQDTRITLIGRIHRSLGRFVRFQVFVPYILNQVGSLLYYKLLGTSDLTFAVPGCNASALVFSLMTSYLLGERIDRPSLGIFGASLVTFGVGICIVSDQQLKSVVSNDLQTSEL
mmetsp:Transcript_6258/g.9090  ORF Transcript_6258/g.9090 Transcript_6258/m.9090 type:complete len:150 (+) Transcript_6258:127-576(+)